MASEAEEIALQLCDFIENESYSEPVTCSVKPFVKTDVETLTGLVITVVPSLTSYTILTRGGDYEKSIGILVVYQEKIQTVEQGNKEQRDDRIFELTEVIEEINESILKQTVIDLPVQQIGEETDVPLFDVDAMDQRNEFQVAYPLRFESSV